MTSTPKYLVHRPSRLHHVGFVVRDQEANRHFMEEVLGIPLIATWCEVSKNPELNRVVEFCHTFYELGDGSALAFFQFADAEMYDACVAQSPAKITRFNHVAFKVSSAVFEELFIRVKKAEYIYRILEHGYCKSLYVKSPDGLELEFSVDPEHLSEIFEAKRSTAHQDLHNWLLGDRRSNNSL